ncbi:Putative HrgA like protein [Helicobacter bizzozeronii]|nr:Putative HrgA like protein [Helicobacter bizzozeronii]
MKQTDIEIVEEVLKAIGEPISPNHIYAKAQELHQQGKIQNMFVYKSKTPEQSCSATIYGALIKTPDKIPFIKVQDKPVLIALKGQDFPPPKPTKEQPSKEPIGKERDLHPRLSYIAYHQWGLYTKTIYHEESKKSKKGMDKWIYPDMVGVSFAYKDFESPNVRSFIKKFDTLPIKLVSFELKRELDLASCREAYFQAISNSSWAHAGYLVAGTLDRNNKDLMELLKQLNQSFGIGVIVLDIERIEQSAILLSAKEKENLDYQTLSKLAERNENFDKFLKSVADFEIENPQRYKHEFDSILKDLPPLN